MLREMQKTLMIEVENKITIGNEAITATVIHQICLFKAKDGSVGADVDIVDIIDVEFLGIKVGESYSEYKKFKTTLSEMGINLDEMIDEECVGLISTSELQQLKNKYRDIFS